ncbi:MAG: DUF4276 family protein [Actinomycetes bacterium]
MKPVVACIVEGHGELQAVPLLVRRIAASLPTPMYVDAPRAIPIPRTKLMRPGELERATKLAMSRVVESQVAGGGVLILIDADTDCAAQLGPELLARARSAAGAVPAEVVLAVMEFEAWFLAALTSLRGERRIRSDAEAPLDPEAIRGAKAGPAPADDVEISLLVTHRPTRDGSADGPGRRPGSAIVRQAVARGRGHAVNARVIDCERRRVPALDRLREVDVVRSRLRMV